MDGALAFAHFLEPWEIVGDGGHTLYVADSNVIRAIDRNTGAVSTLAGKQALSGSADGVGTDATFSLPSGLAISNGQLYVSDTENSTIRKIDVASGAVTTVAGAAGESGMTDGPAAEARFSEPEGIVLGVDGKLYIADTDNNAIRVLTLSTGMVATLAGSPERTDLVDGVGSAASFYKPKALRMDTSGDLYVADTFNMALRKVVPATGAVTTMAIFAVVPQGIALVGDDVLVSLCAPGSSGDNRIVRVSGDAVVSTVAGSAATAGYQDGPAASALFNSPAGLFRDETGKILVVDTGNFVIRELSLDDSTVSTYAGEQSIGSEDGIGAQARFNAPQGLATDGPNVYVADTGNETIRKIDLGTGTVSTLAGAQGQSGNTDGPAASARFHQPQGLAIDRSAQILYVADTINRSIRRVDLHTGVVSTPSWTPSPSFRSLDAPSGLALDESRLYVTDSTDNVVVAFDLRSGQATNLAGRWGEIGTDDGVGTDAAFYRPTGVAADGRGSLFVTDNWGCTLRRIDIKTSTVATLAGVPLTCSTSDGVGSHASFSLPFGITANDLGDLFVSDTHNNTIRHVDASSAAVTTVIGTTQAFGVELGPLPGQLSQPSAVCLTSNGGLLIASENAVLLAH